MTTSKIKDHSSKNNVSLKNENSHKEKTETKGQHFPLAQHGSISLQNIKAFPMKRFKGTKSHLETSDINLNYGRKRKPDAELVDERCFKKEKQSENDPLKVLNKLEKFSDVWNDCPIIENPRSDFEIVQNHENDPRKSIKEIHCEKKGKRTKVYETKDQQNSKKNEAPKNVIVTKSVQKCNKNKNESYERNNGIDVRNNTINECKDKVSGDGIENFDNPRPGKYDSEIAEMKRKKAVKEQSQLHSDQKNIIKKALSSKDSNHQINKKIVFSDFEDNQEQEAKVNQTKNKKLFEDGDSSDSDFELKVNSQFDGKKGQKLLELQSKFASDSRFTLDPRFQDSESEDETLAENGDFQEEKKRQLEILESIVKKPIRPLSETKKAIGKRYDELMVRFDPTKEDHQKYILKPKTPSEVIDQSKEKIKKSKKDIISVPNAEENKPQVSSEKIYAVKDDLKEVLKKENKTEFSLLKLFGSKDEDSTVQQTGSETVKKLKYATKNPFRYDSSESESEGEGEESKIEEPDKVVKPILSSWRTTFFFTDNDSRFKEAEEFLKFPEDEEDDQKFAEKRKMLKDFIRHKVKNNNRKKDPFKKKLGSVLKKKVFNNNKKKGK